MSHTTINLNRLHCHICQAPPAQKHLPLLLAQLLGSRCNNMHTTLNDMHTTNNGNHQPSRRRGFRAAAAAASHGLHTSFVASSSSSSSKQHTQAPHTTPGSQ
jgi:hypothetical protein